MTSRRRGVTITVLRDDELVSAGYRFPTWLLRLGVVAAIVIGVLLVLGVASYAPIARQAARVPGLERELDRLTIDNERIRELALALDRVEANYGKLRRMVGADIAPDPVQLASVLPVAPNVLVLATGERPRYETAPSIPSHWPLDERGYVTRGQNADSTDEAHPGVDVAVPVGTLVRATAGGTVLQTGNDKEYGYFSLIQHPNGYQSMYGHRSRVVAVPGARIRAGEVIGRTGNTGRSSAPHLHFEIRHNGISIDPLTLIRENR